MLNAIQACAPGGRVGLAVEAGETVRIRVTDNGCGIAPDDQKRIFEPFFSLRKGGTGLGLFLSLNSVRRWGGDILVESTLGRGSSLRGRAAGGQVAGGQERMMTEGRCSCSWTMTRRSGP